MGLSALRAWERTVRLLAVHRKRRKTAPNEEKNRPVSNSADELRTANKSDNEQLLQMRSISDIVLCSSIKKTVSWK